MGMDKKLQWEEIAAAFLDGGQDMKERKIAEKIIYYFVNGEKEKERLEETVSFSWCGDLRVAFSLLLEQGGIWAGSGEDYKRADGVLGTRCKAALALGRNQYAQIAAGEIKPDGRCIKGEQGGTAGKPGYARKVSGSGSGF